MIQAPASAAAQRLLVGRRHESQSETGRQAQAFGHEQALVVQWHRHQLRSGGNEAVARADRARVLEPDLVARVEQHCPDQLEGMLSPADDEDLRGIAGDASIGAKMQRDRLAQW